MRRPLSGDIDMVQQTQGDGPCPVVLGKMKFKGKRLASSIVAVETLNLLSTGAHASTSKPDLAKKLPAQSLAKNVAA